MCFDAVLNFKQKPRLTHDPIRFDPKQEVSTSTKMLVHFSTITFIRSVSFRLPSLRRMHIEFSAFSTHSAVFHTHILFIWFSFLSHAVCVCVSFISFHLFILLYLSGAKVFSFICDVTAHKYCILLSSCKRVTQSVLPFCFSLLFCSVPSFWMLLIFTVAMTQNRRMVTSIYAFVRVWR